MNTRRRLQGVVRSSNSEKTVVVEITRSYRHPLYQKVIHTSGKMKVHDELGCRVGDLVQIVESKPISRTKRWMVEKRLNIEENLVAQDELPEVSAADLFEQSDSEEIIEETEDVADDPA